MGGTTDLAGRIVAKALGEGLHQTVVVENKPGAADSVSVAQVLSLPPDGYSMAASGVSSSMLHQLLNRRLPYEPRKDINAVAYLGSSGIVVIKRNPMLILASALSGYITGEIIESSGLSQMA